MNGIAKTPQPPYYAVIFSSYLTEEVEGYAEMGDEMYDLAQKQKGFLGFESVRNEMGITVSYWETLHDIKNWKTNEAHLVAQKKGKSQWYQSFKTRICKVEREYGFEK